MTIEFASTRAVEKPWGRTDLRPWSEAAGRHGRIGEIWYERTDPAAQEPTLLLKLLFTREPLSIKMHPGDAFAQSIGEVRGKSEAWYVMSAEPGGRIALGLDRRLTSQQLREAIADGSIVERIAWRDVSCGDVVDVPAGSIHAIGAGLVIAEIQQRSDTTYRLFDHGRSRALHVEHAVAVADAGQAPAGPFPRALGPGRMLLITYRAEGAGGHGNCGAVAINALGGREALLRSPDRHQARRAASRRRVGGDRARGRVASGSTIFVSI